MSIVVTCSCSRTYRLPDRYAGKKARCRDCGEPIEVPTQEDDAVEKPAQKRKKGDQRSSRAKTEGRGDKARSSTRRLNAEDREIIGERRNLRSSERKRPISESMHQLAPIALSGDRLDMSSTPPSTSRKYSGTKKKTKREVQEQKKKAKEQARSARDADERRAAKKDKKKKKKKSRSKSRAGKEEQTKAQKKAAKARTTKLVQGPEGPSRAPSAKKAEKQKTAKRPLTGAKLRGRSSREGDELEEGAEAAPRTFAAKVAALPVPALLGIAAVLCLGIGLIVGGLVGGGPKSPSEDKRVVKLEQLVTERKWVEAKAELELATAATKGHGDELVAARVRALGRTITPLATIMELPDAGARMRVLSDNIAVPDALVRKAIAVELCDMADEERAQKALQLLAKDQDPRVAAEAKKGLRADFVADEPAPAAAAEKAPEAPKGE